MDYGYLDVIRYAEENNIENVVYIKNHGGNVQSKEEYCIILKNIYDGKEKEYRTVSDFKKYFELKNVRRGRSKLT